MADRATIVVREHALLTAGNLPPGTPTHPLDRAQISESAFRWLLELNQRVRSKGQPLLHLEDRTWLRLDNYVGFIQTPCGTELEILPKHYDSPDAVHRSRDLLQRMILAALDLPSRATDTANVRTFNAPLTEWLAAQFLRELDSLVNRGVRFQYERIEEEQRFLRGQLDAVKMIRQRPDRRHIFPIRHDVHVASRPENRLLRSCLDHVVRHSRDAGNWRRASELRTLFAEVPASADVDLDFSRWADDRLMAHYRPIRPWAELILHEQSPLAIRGAWTGTSLLFPMEKLFERYVGAWLRRNLRSGVSLRAPAASKYLCEYESMPMFRLEPDFLVTYRGENWVLDAKWKLLSARKEDNFGLSQADFYQMFAYGQRYLGGQGDMFLVFPQRDHFPSLSPFHMAAGLKLWVSPFDLESSEGITAEVFDRLPLSGSTLTQLPDSLHHRITVSS